MVNLNANQREIVAYLLENDGPLTTADIAKIIRSKTHQTAKEVKGLVQIGLLTKEESDGSLSDTQYTMSERVRGDLQQYGINVTISFLEASKKTEKMIT